jgi:hypothetical protein
MKRLLIVLALLAVSCTQQIVISDLDTNKIRYAQDPRTGLCFAYTGSVSADNYKIISLTCVPCNAVENLLK